MSEISTSETSKVRHIVAKYCVGCGVDVGYGGDPILESAICIDKVGQYTTVGDKPCHVRVDGPPFLTDLFNVESIDYVYSSHLLEDYPQHEINDLIDEWAHVLVPGGHMVICCPDEQLYLAHCDAKNEQRNTHHSNPEFSIDNIIQPMEAAGLRTIFFEIPVGIYSFVVVGVKQ